MTFALGRQRRAMFNVKEFRKLGIVVLLGKLANAIGGHWRNSLAGVSQKKRAAVARLGAIAVLFVSP
jgi:hypothetical protein